MSEQNHPEVKGLPELHQEMVIVMEHFLPAAKAAHPWKGINSAISTAESSCRWHWLSHEQEKAYRAFIICHGETPTPKVGRPDPVSLPHIHQQIVSIMEYYLPIEKALNPWEDSEIKHLQNAYSQSEGWLEHELSKAREIFEILHRNDSYAHLPMIAPPFQ